MTTQGKSPGPAPRVIIAVTLLSFVVIQAVFFSKTAGGNALAFSKEGIQNVGQTFAPLVAIAAFIERAVEVVISIWRGPGTLDLEHALDAAKEGGGDTRPEQLALERYKLGTQSYAFCVALGLSLLASLVGVRATAALVDASSTTMSPRQHLGFAIFDVTLTSLLLAGGCDGIHQVVTTITKFLDTSKDKMKA